MKMTRFSRAFIGYVIVVGVLHSIYKSIRNGLSPNLRFLGDLFLDAFTGSLLIVVLIVMGLAGSDNGGSVIDHRDDGDGDGGD